MNRKKLISAVQEICLAKGYAFCVLDSAQLPVHTPPMPAAVLIHPTFRSIEGRNHGRITYRVTLYLFEQGARLQPSETCEKVVALESVMLDIFSQLSENESVAVVDNLQMEQMQNVKLGRKEVALTATADVEVIF
jgi:hypothetical protein